MLNLMIVNLFGLMTPGPDFFYVVRMSAGNSRRNAICAILGICIGIGFWASLSLLGLAVILATLPMLHGAIMLLGGAYLSYCGVSLWRTKTNVELSALSAQELNQQTSIRKEIMKGLLVNLSNAKAVVFFSSVMSLVLANITNVWQMSLALAIIVLEGFVYFYVISLVFSRNIAKRIYGRYTRYIDNAAGAVFLFFGLLLIYSGINEMIH